ncbi:MAG: hypothetical protein LAO51_11600 [Acidobacteriia bacterium]|nr:hypothetical protein [Terriglobia bacterium]
MTKGRPGAGAIGRSTSRRIAAAAAIALVAALGAAPARSAGEKVAVRGEVIDSACYIKMGARGESHRECAQKCADAGIPLALLEDGTGRVIWLASENDAETPNKTLRPHAGRKVTIRGTWAERGGAKILIVEAVEPAGA